MRAENWKGKGFMCRASCRWRDWKPSAGFRFAPHDAFAIVICVAVTMVFCPILGNIVILFPVVLGHFFLFCNVFRVPRYLELSWSGIFVVNVGIWVSLSRLDWIVIVVTQLPPTLLAISIAIVSNDYHGIGYSLVPWGRRLVDDERH
jgi:hypothetical protein